MRETLNEQRIIVLLNVEFMILIKSNRLSSADILSSIVNRF